MLVCLSGLLVGCTATNTSDDETTTEMINGLMDVVKDGTDEFVNEVDSATHDDVDRLKEEGNEMLSSLDEVETTLEEDGEDFPAEAKERITNDVNEIRQTITDALAKLDTK